jgi:hypothetical protein
MSNNEQGILNVEVMQHLTSIFKIPCSLFNIRSKTQLPLDPPVLIGFLVAPVAFVPGLAINLEPWPMPPLGPLLPGLPLFLLFTGNDISFNLSV